VTRTTHRGIAVLALAASALGGIALSAPAHAATTGSAVRNVIYLLGDGMGRTHVTAGRERYHGAAGKLNMEKLPVVGQVSTYSVEKGSTLPSLVPDSAATGTAWSTGVKTYNNAISVDAYGKKVSTLMEQAHAAGMRTGDVSTAEVTDATPAVMVSHALLRGCQGPVYSASSCLPSGDPAPSDPTLVTPIAEQISKNGTADVIFGGGLSRFEPEDSDNLKALGYKVLGSFGDPAVGTNNGKQTASTQTVATRDDLASVTTPGSKVIGLFNRGNMTVEKAKADAAAGAAIKNEPSLAEMTTKSLQLLNQSSSKGFLLQVEGALIDKRSHANDATQTLGEIKAFDDAVQVAKDFADKDGHTLVIVTADHECAGFNIIEHGTIANAETSTFPGTGNVDSGNTANNSPQTRSGSQTKDPARSVGTQNDGGPGQALVANFAPATFRTADDPAGVTDGSPQASLWLTYLSGNHTGADVPIFAGGPESSRFANSQDQTSLYTKMHAALQALGNESTASAPAARSIAWHSYALTLGKGKVSFRLADVTDPQPTANVELFEILPGGNWRNVYRSTLTNDGKATRAPYVGYFGRSGQHTYQWRVSATAAGSARTLGQPFTVNFIF
jgi:alkaline phosphatase